MVPVVCATAASNSVRKRTQHNAQMATVWRANKRIIAITRSTSIESLNMFKARSRPDEGRDAANKGRKKTYQNSSRLVEHTRPCSPLLMTTERCSQRSGGANQAIVDHSDLVEPPNVE